MPFSLGSYILGVGTVVGALAFGFGGGVLMTKTAMKETPAGPTRIERVARSEPEPAAQQHDANNNPAPPAAPAPATNPPATNSDPAQAATPQPDTRRATESATEPEQAAKQPEQAAKQPEPARQAEPVNQTEQKDAEMQKKAADRKAERQKRYADRKDRSFATSRTRQPPSEQQDQPGRTEFVFGPEEPHFFGREEPRGGPHFNLFGLSPFDRSYDRAPPPDRDDD
jgi:hypothetical protein